MFLFGPLGLIDSQAIVLNPGVELGGVGNGIVIAVAKQNSY